MTIDPSADRLVYKQLADLIRAHIEAGSTAGAQVTVRMQTEPERKQLGMAEGVPILVMTEPDGEVRKLPADRIIVEASKGTAGLKGVVCRTQTTGPSFHPGATPSRNSGLGQCAVDATQPQ
ncbi:hypothetical protein ACGFIJ_20055 [Microbispora bryophytorum]|uniref:hypothetical protein n=1 Tax=Microbispora bryophytorum TaxID=1460882 RepID=UPI0037161F39